MNDEDDTLAVEEFVDYCRTQAGLLAGKVERMGEEADALLDEVDEELASLRTQLEGERVDLERAESPPSPDHAGELDVAALEDVETDLEEKQALVDAKQARMRAFQELAAGYTELAEELQELDDGREAMERVVEFEADHDAPVYFQDRQTVYEAAASDDE